MIRDISKCKFCGKEFVKTRVNKIYCTKECANKSWVKRNKDHVKSYKARTRYKYSKKQKEKREKFQRELNEYKLSLGCNKCNYKKCAEALDFHHLYGKEVKHMNAWVYGYEYERFKKEEEKCILLCKNCHTEEHKRRDDKRFN